MKDYPALSPARLTRDPGSNINSLSLLIAWFCLVFMSANALAQAPGGKCSLGKAAKLFKEQSGMAFHTKLKAGQDVSLIKQIGTRWEVAAPDGTIGYLDAAWMNKICWYTEPAPTNSTQAPADTSTRAAATQLDSAPEKARPSVSHGHTQASPPGKDYEPKRGIGSMALLPIEGERLDPGLAKVCSNLIASHLGKVPGRTLVTADEISAMLSLEEQKMALACDDASCMAEIGGALGVDELIRVSLGKLGSKLIISMSRILVAEASVLGRSTVKIDNVEDDYDRGFQQAVSEIYQLKTPGQAPSTKSVVAATAPLSVSALDGEGPTPWPSYLSMALGTAALGAGVYFGLQAKTNEDLANSNDVGSQQAIVDAQDQSLLANILYGVGGLGLGTGLYLLFTGDATAETAATSQGEIPVSMTRFELIPLVNGAVLSLGGTY